MEDRKLAVLIDSENISGRRVKKMFEKIRQYGEIICCRIYGNWSKNSTWKKSAILEYGMVPVQQFEYASGKNSADITMVIDAMDLMASGIPDGFVLVTGDSDFTRLALRIRQQGLFVAGFGMGEKTPNSLVKAVNVFVDMESWKEEKTEPAAKPAAKGKGKTAAKPKPEPAEAKPAAKAEPQPAAKPARKGRAEKIPAVPEEEVRRTIRELIGKEPDRTISPAELGRNLSARYPNLKFTDYGCKQLTDFLNKNFPGVIIDENRSVRLPETEQERTSPEQDIREILLQHGGAVNNLGFISTEMKKKDPGFSSRKYGFKSMTTLLKSFPDFQVAGNTVRLKSNQI
ncbi:MAG: NYN domain-containing protein [Bacteroidales bacterium]|nr:NYN domain-containing protein [Bacteroidales bacterium]